MSVPLSQVAEINPKANLSALLSLDEMFDFLPMADVSENGVVSVTAQRPLSEVQKGFTAFRKGDILIAKITPCFENNKIAIADINTEIGFGSTEFHVVRCDHSKLDSRYLLHFLRSDGARAEGKRRMTGSAGQQRVPKKYFEDLQIPLPPLEEQKRIAAILDQADDLRRKRQRALDRLNQLGQAIFVEMFGDPLSGSQKYPTTALESLCSIISDCLHTTPNHFDEPSPYPSIRSSELQNGYIDLRNAKYVNKGEYITRTQRCKPLPGDTIYCREGARYGNAGFVPKGLTPCLGQRTMLFRANEYFATPEYLWATICSESIYRQAASVVGGAASPHVNIGDIREFKCILAPMPIQLKFSEVIKQIFILREYNLSEITSSDALFASLQHRAFRGELTAPRQTKADP